MTRASCKVLTDGTTLQHGENGFVLVQIIRIDGIDQDDDFATLSEAIDDFNELDFALNLPFHDDRPGGGEVPRRGFVRIAAVDIQPDLTYRSVPLFCINVVAKHPQKSGKNVAEVHATWAEIGVPMGFNTPDDWESGGLLNGPTPDGHYYSYFVGAEYNGTTVNAQTSLQWKVDPDTGQETFGDPLIVYYKPGTPGYDFATDASRDDNVKRHIVYAQYAKMPTLEAMVVAQFRMREIANSAHPLPQMQSLPAKLAYYNGAMNSEEFMGYPAYTLRMRMNRGEVDALRSLDLPDPNNEGSTRKLQDTLYTLEYRKRTWKEINVMQDPYTGFNFPDTDNPSTDLASATPKGYGNGWRQGSPLREVDFNELGLPDLRQL